MDAISSQYGWNDQQILDLYLCRVNQIKDSIFIRQYNEMQSKLRETEWSTKTICAFVVASAQIEQKGKEQLQKMLEKISLTDTSSDKSFVPDSERSIEDIIENGSVAEALERNEGKSLSSLFQV